MFEYDHFVTESFVMCDLNQLYDQIQLREPGAKTKGPSILICKKHATLFLTVTVALIE